MLISHRYKFITIDIPRTGTNSLRNSLRPLNCIDIIGVASLDAEYYQHGIALDLKEKFDQKGLRWDNYFKFTVSRNPWQRYFSILGFHQRLAEEYSNGKIDGWDKNRIKLAKINKEWFDTRPIRSIFLQVIKGNKCQSEYYEDDFGNCIVDYIADFNRYESEFIYLCNKIGIDPPELLHLNKGLTEDYRDHYDDELIDIVEKKEHRIISLKGYKYGSKD